MISEPYSVKPQRVSRKCPVLPLEPLRGLFARYDARYLACGSPQVLVGEGRTNSSNRFHQSIRSENSGAERRGFWRWRSSVVRCSASCGKTREWRGGRWAMQKFRPGASEPLANQKSVHRAPIGKTRERAGPRSRYAKIGGVSPKPRADAARVGYLNVDEITRLINAANPDFRPMIQAALLTGARYGEIAALRVSDYNPDVGTVSIRQGKTVTTKHIVLSDDGRKYFEAHTVDKAGDALIFTRADGEQWGDAHQNRPMQEAVRRANINPAINFHGLRHTYASHAAMNGMPLPVLAQNLGHTSTRMSKSTTPT
jgi:hypothetical protein